MIRTNRVRELRVEQALPADARPRLLDLVCLCVSYLQPKASERRNYKRETFSLGESEMIQIQMIGFGSFGVVLLLESAFCSPIAMKISCEFGADVDVPAQKRKNMGVVAKEASLHYRITNNVKKHKIGLVGCEGFVICRGSCESYTYEEDSPFQAVTISMEYVSGGTLFNYIICKTQAPLTEAASAFIFLQLSACISLLMQKCKVLHRDIKLENVLLMKNEDEIEKYRHRINPALFELRCHLTNRYSVDSANDFPIVMLCDMSWAVEVGSSESDDAHFCGTLDYFSPEQLKGHPSGYSSQVWSLGILLAELLTGFVSPFGVYQYSALSQFKRSFFYRKVLFELPDLENLKLSDASKQTLQHLLHKDPQYRDQFVLADYFCSLPLIRALSNTKR